MFDEPFEERPECDTWGYMLVDTLLYLLATSFWWLFLCIKILATIMGKNKANLESEWER